MDNQAIKGGLEVFTTAIGAVKALVGLAGSPKNNDVGRQVDDVLAKLGEAREKYIEMQGKYLAAVDENRQLKERLVEKDCVVFHDGAYWRKRDSGEEGPFCPACQGYGKLVRGQVNSVYGGQVEFSCPYHKGNYLFNVPESLVKDIPLDSYRQRSDFAIVPGPRHDQF